MMTCTRTHAFSATFICTASQSSHTHTYDARTPNSTDTCSPVPPASDNEFCALAYIRRLIRAKIYKMPFHSIPIPNDYYCSQSEWQRIKCCRQSLARLLAPWLASAWHIDGRPSIAPSNESNASEDISTFIFIALGSFDIDIQHISCDSFDVRPILMPMHGGGVAVVLTLFLPFL